MNNGLKVSKTRRITYFAVLTAITVILQLFANAIPVGLASLNFSLIPIVVAGMLLGVWYGTALGAVSGIITTIQVVSGNGGLFSIMFMQAPVMIILICMLKITLAAFIGAFVFKVVRNKLIATFIASALVPTVNTLVFFLGMLILSGQLPSAAAEFGVSVGDNVLVYILEGLVGFNYFIELGINLILAPAVYRVIRVADKSFNSQRTENTDNAEDKGE